MFSVSYLSDVFPAHSVSFSVCVSPVIMSVMFIHLFCIFTVCFLYLICVKLVALILILFFKKTVAGGFENRFNKQYSILPLVFPAVYYCHKLLLYFDWGMS